MSNWIIDYHHALLLRLLGVALLLGGIATLAALHRGLHLLAQIGRKVACLGVRSSVSTSQRRAS